MRQLTQQLIRDGDMVMWHDYRSRSFRDWSGNGWDGTPANVAFNREGMECFRNGVNSFCTFGDIDSASGSWTFFVLAKHHSFEDFQGYLSKGSTATDQNYYLRTDDGNIEFYFRNAANTTNRLIETVDAVVLEVAILYGIAISHTWGSTADTQIYLNGTALATSIPAGADDLPLTNNSDGGIGARSPGVQAFVGNIGTVMIINRILTATEHSQLFGEISS